MDRHNVVELLEDDIKKQRYFNDGFTGPVTMSHLFVVELIKLLKEQKVIEIDSDYTHLPYTICPKCKSPIDRELYGRPGKQVNFCSYCGQAVKWD